MSKQDYPGSRWWKFDFHCHTPASDDYRGNKTITPSEWLENYYAQGIQCLVITDHNTGAWVDKLKTALAQLKASNAEKWHDFTLFPGMELSCNGGVHLKVILDPEKGSSDLDAIRGSVKYFRTPGDSDGVTQLSVEQVIEQIHGFGGIACAAHIDKPKGLITAITDHHTLQAILHKLDAVEVINPEDAAIQPHKDSLTGLAWVLGSDSHKPAEIGRGYTWVKMSKPSIEGLRLALLDPESAIQRSDLQSADLRTLPSQWITSITLENMHLNRAKPLPLQFNPAYNTIIGGRGSGKSTVLECLRLALGRDGELEKLGADSEIWKTFSGFKAQYQARDRPGMMLEGTKITVEAIKGHGATSERYRFVWSKQAGTTSGNSFATKLFRMDDDTTIWQDTSLTLQQITDTFPIKIFSQKQILALANNPQSLLEHIDNAIANQKNTWSEKFDLCKTKLLAARLRVRTLRKELEKKPDLLLQYKEASRKALIFTNSNFGPLLKQYQRATQQKRALDDFYQLIGNDLEILQAGIAQVNNLASTELNQFLTESAAEIAARDAALTLKTQLLENYQKIVSIAANMQTQMHEALAVRASSPWQQENEAPILAYATETARLRSEGINSAQEAGLAVATEERLRKQLEQIKKFEDELLQAEKDVEDAAQALSLCRAELTQIRTDFVTQLLVQNDTLKVTLRSMASTASEVTRFRGILKLGTGETFAQHIWQEQEGNGNGEKMSGVLWDLVANTDAINGNQLIPDRIKELKQALEEINQKQRDPVILRTRLHAQLVRRIEELPAEALDELSWWFPEDEVILAYRTQLGDNYKGIALASAGQKTAAMLSFLLLHGDEPLLMDQPEDDLDNAIVSELVVAQLRNNKAHRQLIVVTHNANIVVNADADLVMTMKFTGQIELASSGGLQETKVRQDICRVMEGGEQAFRQRYKRILEDLKE